MTTTLPDTLSESTRDFVSRTHGMLIGGAWLPAVSGETLETLDPSGNRIGPPRFAGGHRPGGRGSAQGL